MQYKKLTPKQRALKHWHDRRNALVSEILTAAPTMLRTDALELANRRMRAKGDVFGFEEEKPDLTVRVKSTAHGPKCKTHSGSKTCTCGAAYELKEDLMEIIERSNTSIKIKLPTRFDEMPDESKRLFP